MRFICILCAVQMDIQFFPVIARTSTLCWIFLFRASPPSCVVGGFSWPNTADSHLRSLIRMLFAWKKKGSRYFANLKYMNMGTFTYFLNRSTSIVFFALFKSINSVRITDPNLSIERLFHAKLFSYSASSLVFSFCLSPFTIAELEQIRKHFFDLYFAIFYIGNCILWIHFILIISAGELLEAHFD